MPIGRRSAVIVSALLLVSNALVLLNKRQLRALYNSKRGRITRGDLTPFPGLHSPWAYLHRAQNDRYGLNILRLSVWLHRAYVLTCGLTVASFESLLERFQPIWSAFTPCTNRFDRVSGVKRVTSRRGRPRTLDAAGGLAITLHWLRSKCHLWCLCLIFGTTPSVTAVWVQYGLLVLSRLLRRVLSPVMWLPSMPSCTVLLCCLPCCGCPPCPPVLCSCAVLLSLAVLSCCALE